MIVCVSKANIYDKAYFLNVYLSFVSIQMIWISFWFYRSRTYIHPSIYAYMAYIKEWAAMLISRAPIYKRKWGPTTTTTKTFIESNRQRIAFLLLLLLLNFFRYFFLFCFSFVNLFLNFILCIMRTTTKKM